MPTTPLPPSYCGRCGAPLPPGAPFCGRCGAPHRVQAAPLYSYATTSPAARAAARGNIGHGRVIAIVAAVLLIAAGGGALLANVLTKPVGHCSFDCGPPVGRPLAEAQTYTSSEFGFQVDYSAPFSEAQSDGHTLVLQDRNGTVTVVGQQRSKGDDQLVSDAAANLPSAQVQNVSSKLPVNGAHVGSAQGSGTIFSADGLPANGGEGSQLRVAIVAATRGDVSVVVVAAMSFDNDPRNPGGVAEAGLIDYFLTEFRWGK